MSEILHHPDDSITTNVIPLDNGAFNVADDTVKDLSMPMMGSKYNGLIEPSLV